MLPVDDASWFSRSPRRSCLLLPDPSARWKALVSANVLSPKAWFIVVNSLMRTTQLLVCSSSRPPSATSASKRAFGLDAPEACCCFVDATRESQSQLLILKNCLYSFEMNLPEPDPFTSNMKQHMLLNTI